MDERTLLKKAERKWIEEEDKIDPINYWWYRYFSNKFENWLIKKLLEETEDVDYKDVY